jgi:Delta14-sterol reductase
MNDMIDDQSPLRRRRRSSFVARRRALTKKNAKHTKKQFFGPHGPLLLVPALPAVVLGLVAACNAEGCLSLSAAFAPPPPGGESSESGGGGGAFSFSGLAARARAVAASLPGFPRHGSPIYTHEAMAAALGWFCLVLALHLVLPGKYALGAPLPDGSGRRLRYKLNAAPVFFLVYGAALVLSFGLGALDLAWAADNFLPLATASVILSSGLAVVVYAASFLPPGAGGVGAEDGAGGAGEGRGGANGSGGNGNGGDAKRGGRRLLSSHGATGVPWYDFWMGRELNPRVRLSLPPAGTATCPLLPKFVRAGAAQISRKISSDLDLKEFCELYPGMMAWALLNLSFAFRQARDHPGQGLFGLGISNAMLLVNAFELWYIVDALLNEDAILTTMDITTDGFGFMLCFGDLAWVPFTFATQARFLAEAAGAFEEQELSAWALAGVLAVQFCGYAVFRGANGQKNAFRRDPSAPSVAHLRSMPTRRGTRLLVSGWWGLARHVNYFGDWIMGLAWCLPTGFRGLNAVVPFFYSIYFASLLCHRERRDDAACSVKYGADDWGRYCALVPWRIVPWVY